MYKGIVNRLVKEDKQTLGVFHLYHFVKEVFQCAVLELPDKDNERSISNIPTGTYIAEKRWSEKYNWHYIIKDVPNRDYILIHFGNYYTDTRGCLLFGNDFHDINKDGHRDITSSKATMKKLLQHAPCKFTIQINEL